MVGHIGQDRHQHRQVFRQIAPPGMMPARDANGGWTFIPWKRQSPTPTRTRDAARSNTHTIAQHIASKITIADVINAAKDIDARMSALEQKRAAQRQLAEQQQLQLQLQQQQIVNPRSAQTQYEKPPSTPTQDRAPRCACGGKQPCVCGAPQTYDHAQRIHNEVRTMTMDTTRNAQLAPNRHLTFGAPSRSTRDQRQDFGEHPSRFDSQEQSRLVSYMPGAGAPDSHERGNPRGAMQGASGANVRGNMVEAVSSDPSERFVGAGPFDQFRNDVTRPSPAALSELNAQYSKAKLPATRDALEKHWKDYMTGSPSRDAMANARSPWAPRQPAISPQGPNADNTKDAPWSSLYEANKGTIGGDPNKISPGQTLNLPGGGTHTVTSGETLSGIAASSGSDLGGKSLASETGGVSPTTSAGPSGSYSSGGDLTSGEGAPAGAPGSHNAANAPTPPVKPDLGSSGGGSSGWTDPGKMDYSVSNTGKSGPDVSGGVPVPPTRPADLGSSSSGAGIHPLASEGGSGLSQSGGSSDYEDSRKPRGPRGRK